MVVLRLASALLLSLVLAACAVEGSVGDGDGDGDTLPTGDYMDQCDIESETACEEPYFCFGFNQGGPHCTKECDVDADCEAPSTGCNGMGVCKRPGG